MQIQDIKTFEIYHTGFARSCEIVSVTKRAASYSTIVRSCGGEANYERKLVHKDGFTIFTALCSRHVSADLETYAGHDN